MSYRPTPTLPVREGDENGEIIINSSLGAYDTFTKDAGRLKECIIRPFPSAKLIVFLQIHKLLSRLCKKHPFFYIIHPLLTDF